MVGKDRDGNPVFEEMLVQRGRFPEGLEQEIIAIVRSHFPTEIPADIPFGTHLCIKQIYVSFNRGILEFEDAVPSDDSKKISGIIKKIEKAKSEIRKLSTPSLLALWAIGRAHHLPQD